MTRPESHAFIASAIALALVFACAAWVGVERTRTERAAIVCGQQPNQ